MEYIAYIFQLAIGITFGFAGITKMISITETSKFASKIGMFPKRVGAVLGVSMPIIEVVSAYFLVMGINNLFANLIVTGLILFFIFLNIKSVLEEKSMACFCYGKIIKTKFGLGGFYHYLFLFIMFIFFLYLNSVNLVYCINNLRLEENMLIITASFLLFVTGLSIRIVFDVIHD